MQLTSPAFGDGQPIPKQYTGDGADQSPPLRWQQVPQGAAELVLMVEDPDAPRSEPFVHWLVYKIPADSNELPANVLRQEQLMTPPGALQGVNDFGRDNLGYRGPAPPRGHGVHHYHFKLYAIDEPLRIGAGADKTVLIEVMRGHILAETELVGTYHR